MKISKLLILLFVPLLCSCEMVYKKTSSFMPSWFKDDWFGEEITEEIIESKTGIEGIDLSPSSKE